MTREQILRLAKVVGKYITINDLSDGDIVIFVNDIRYVDIPKAFYKFMKMLNDTCISKDEEIDEYFFNGFEVEVFFLSTDI